MCVTNYRVLLVDRKPMLLTIEDIRYDMMSEVDFHNRLLGASLKIFTPMRNMIFSSWSSPRLRKSVNYIQQRVMEIRQHNVMGQQMQTMAGVPQPHGALNPAAGQYGQAGMIMPQSQPNPYTKVPMLQRRRRFPSFY